MTRMDYSGAILILWPPHRELSGLRT